MPRPKKAARRNLVRANGGSFAMDKHDDVEEDEFEMDLVDAYDSGAANALDELEPSDEFSGSYIRGMYKGDSRWTDRRKRIQQAELAATMANSAPITSYFLPVTNLNVDIRPAVTAAINSNHLHARL
ncbi:hypothetical protein [Absidia glauca]|uniref:Uncharacterized protein n=1 Tax=Absidia glauca TaxID=4829 RepID=A0A168PPE4_ABSGL|nr:hypothetical protein [Absidia glauca]